MNNQVEDIIPLATMLREYSDEALEGFNEELKIIETRLRILNNRLYDLKDNSVDKTLSDLDNHVITYPQAETVLRALGLFQEEIDRYLGVNPGPVQIDAYQAQRMVRDALLGRNNS